MEHDDRIYFEERVRYSASRQQADVKTIDNEEVKTWPFDDVLVDSPIGILCRCTNITVSIFRARPAGGGYECYLGMIYNLYGGLGQTKIAWPPPPAGLALSIVLRGKKNAFLGEFPLPRQDVNCGENGRMVSARFDKVNPDVYPLVELAQLWTLEASWLRC